MPALNKPNNLPMEAFFASLCTPVARPDSTTISRSSSLVADLIAELPLVGLPTTCATCGRGLGTDEQANFLGCCSGSCCKIGAWLSPTQERLNKAWLALQDAQDLAASRLEKLQEAQTEIADVLKILGADPCDDLRMAARKIKAERMLDSLRAWEEAMGVA